MKTFIIILILTAIGVGSIFYLYGSAEIKIRTQAAIIARQQLIIDSLRNPVDTTEFLTEHSELR